MCLLLDYKAMPKWKRMLDVFTQLTMVQTLPWPLLLLSCVKINFNFRQIVEFPSAFALPAQWACSGVRALVPGTRCDARIHAEHCPWRLWQGDLAGFTRNQERGGCLAGDPGLPEPFSTDTAGSPRSPGKLPVCKHCQSPVNFSGKHSQMVQEKHSDGFWQCLTSDSACVLTGLKKLRTRYPREVRSG